MATLYVQSPTLYQASSGNIVGATSVTLTSLTDIYGNVLTMADFGSLGYITLEPDTTNSEGATFTGVTANANGTYTLTGVKTILAKSPYTQTSGLIRQHSGGTKVVITDNVSFWDTFVNKNNDSTILGKVTLTSTQPMIYDVEPTLTDPKEVATKAYADALALASAVPATPSAIGYVKLSAVSATPTLPVVVETADTRMPTQGENDALVGTLGNPSSTNRYVTEQMLTTVTAMGAQAIDGTLGSIFTRTLANNETFTQSGFTAGRCFMVEVKQGSGTSYTATWFSGITWVTGGATAPIQTTVTNGTTTYGFRCTGTNTFLGYLVASQ